MSLELPKQGNVSPYKCHLNYLDKEMCVLTNVT